MRAPEETITADEARKAARQYADAEGSGWIGTTSKNRTPGEYWGLVEAIWNHVLNIPREHRKRKYARDLLTVALRAYDLRMESRHRSEMRRIESYRQAASPQLREGER